MEMWKKIVAIGVSTLMIGGLVGMQLADDSNTVSKLVGENEVLQNQVAEYHNSLLEMESTITLNGEDIADVTKLLENKELEIASLGDVITDKEAIIEEKIAEIEELLGGKAELENVLAEKDMTIEDYKNALEDEMELNPFEKIQKIAFKQVEKEWGDLELDEADGERFSDDEYDYEFEEDYLKLKNIDIEDDEWCAEVMIDEIEYDDGDVEARRDNIEVEVCKDEDGDFEVELLD